MKILMMSNTYFPIVGGLERSIDLFSEELGRRGHEVVIAAPQFEGTAEKEDGVVRLPAILNFNRTDFSVNLPIPGLLSGLFEKFQPDLIHSHHPFLVGDMALRLSGRYGIPMVFTYHTMYELYTHYLPFTNEAVRQFMIGLSANYANLAGWVIAPCEGVKKVLQKRGVEVPITVIPTGVDPKQFARGDGERFRKERCLAEEDFVVGYAGRLAPEKNLEFLAKSVAAFLQREPRGRFLILGKGPSKAEMIEIFKGSGVEKRVLFAGVLSGEKLIDAYHALNVFAFTSKTETQGLALAEAMAAGVPVVALDALGTGEVVRDRKNGRLVGKENVSEFVSALKWCRGRRPEEWRRLREEAKTTAETLSMKRMTERLLAVYEKVRAHRQGLDPEKLNALSSVANRIKTEWDILSSIGKATGFALSEWVADGKRKLRRAGRRRRPG